MCFSDKIKIMWTDRPIRISKFTSVLCEPGWSWNNHILSDFDLWFVWSGRGWASFNNQRFDLTPGSIICFRPGNAYSAGHDDSNRMGICVFHFDPIDASGRKLTLPPNQLPPHFARLPETDLHQRLLKHAASLYQSSDPPAITQATLHARGVLCAMAGASTQPILSGREKAHHDAIWSAVRHIRENPADLFSIDALAARQGYSSDHFSRLFKQIVGQSPKEFCIHTRLQRAQTLLRESAMSIQEVASALGYSDMFFFSKQFKTHTGLSPSRWRHAQQSHT
jgi:AraC family transcriptional regulator, arabinose operon regulatory protein